MYYLTPIGVLDDSRVTVPFDDPAYLAWLQDGNSPTLEGWPTPEEEAETFRKFQAREQAPANFRNLPNWSNMTGPEVVTYITGLLFNGMSEAELDAWIDENVVQGANLAETMANIRTALKLIVKAIKKLQIEVCIREGQAIVYLRDIVIR